MTYREIEASLKISKTSIQKNLLRIGIPSFVCQKSSPSFEKSTPKEESSSAKTFPKKQGSI
ncbi:unnamed protein product [Acanthoscelides obtectus]|uniref:Uncharacterized protein n=1 Tax=Acanthoscelides obtectus TaxID=200917 RepID=A0A9P0PBZ4_ACAOB|nr:unnamed protein product [Acanthoscelides obtectus]CAK1653714.1 hypothetical protein AOBTE_LOCUS18339 [Acanthoscelides obtectus]